MTMKSRYQGFGLIELMVSIVIGLIVLTGITSLVVATMRANSENLEMTRLTQDMRASIQLITQDLRRAGYSRDALLDFGTGAQANNEFTNVQVFDTGGDNLSLQAGFDDPPGICIIFSYDSNADGAADANEFRGFRLNEDTSQLEAKVSGAAADSDCNAGTWEGLTDPATMQVERFEITTRDGGPVPVMEDSAGNPVLTVRELQVALEARLVGDEDVTRTMRETVRVRNDLLN